MRARTQIWSGELIDLAKLLIERKHDEQNNYKFSLLPARDGAPPQMQVSAKPKLTIDNFQNWQKAFEIYMAILLLQPHNIIEAPKMINYINTIRNLCERGGNWGLYDETFRSMRVDQDWQWDTVHWELWLNAQPVSRPQPVSGASFLGKGKLSQRNNKVCYAFNRGVQCRQPCSYAPKCKRCGEPHPVKRCRANNNRSPPVVARAGKK